MSLYHFSRTVVQRSTGGSASKALSYIHRTKVRDEFLGKTYSFKMDDGEIVKSEIHIPENSPKDIKEIAKEFKSDPSSAVTKLGNMLDNVENDFINKRYRTEDMRLAQQLRAQTSFMDVLALQKEFSLEENEFLVAQYVDRVYTSKGLIATSAIHFEDNNPHVHIMVGQRGVDGKGFKDKKEREVLSRAGLKACRKEWEEINNQLFRYKNMNSRITAESFKTLGIELVPTIHEGDDRFRKFSEQFVETNKSINLSHIGENKTRILEDPSCVIPSLTSRKTTFTEQHVRDEIEKYFPENPTLVHDLAAKALESDRVINLEKNIHGDMKYASEEYLKSEEALLEHANTLLTSGKHHISEEVIRDKLKEKFDFLSDEQKQVIHEACRSESLQLIVGRAGTGKSTMMEAVSELYKEKGYEVFGSAWAGAAAEDLGEKINGPSLTLKSWLNRWENFEQKAYEEQGFLKSEDFHKALREQINPRTVFILDEAGTVDVDHFNQLLTRAQAAGAKVIALGDYNQTAPIGPGAAFHALCEASNHSLVEQVRRQRHEWMCKASIALSHQDAASALEMYERKGCIHWEAEENVHLSLVKDYLKEYTDGRDQLIVASTNKDVSAINAEVHAELVANGHVAGLKEFDVKTAQGSQTLAFGINDRLIFLQNDHREYHIETLSGKGMGVKNGSMGTVVSIQEDQIKVRLDDNRVVGFNPEEYNQFTHGYALTIHKSQGKTFEKSYALVNGSQTADMTYVALTRHQSQCGVYVNQDKCTDLHSLIPQVSQINALNFVNRDKVYGDLSNVFDTLHLYRDLKIERSAQYEMARTQAEKNGEKFYEQPSYEKAKGVEEELKKVASSLLDHWDVAKNYSREFNLDKYSLEILAGTREKARTNAQVGGLKVVDEYDSLSKDVKAYVAHAKAHEPDSFLPDHSKFEAYRDLKAKQAQLSLEISKDPVLYRPLLAERHLGFKGVENHAESYSALYENGPVSELVRSFMEWKTSSGFAYSLIIEDLKEQKVEKKDIQERIKGHEHYPLLEKTRAQAMNLAHQVLQNDITKDLQKSLPSYIRDGLTHMANQHQVGLTAKNYVQSIDPFERQAYGKEIQKWLESGKYTGLTQLRLAEEGVEKAMLKVDRLQDPTLYSDRDHYKVVRAAVEGYKSLNREIATGINSHAPHDEIRVLVDKRNELLSSVAEYPRIMQCLFTQDDYLKVNYELPQKARDQVKCHENRVLVGDFRQEGSLDRREELADNILERLHSDKPLNMKGVLYRENVTKALLNIHSNEQGLKSEGVIALSDYETQRIETSMLWKEMCKDAQSQYQPLLDELKERKEDISAQFTEKAIVDGRIQTFTGFLSELEKLSEKQRSRVMSSKLSVFMKDDMKMDEATARVTEYLGFKVKADKEILSLKMEVVNDHKLSDEWTDRRFGLYEKAHDLVSVVPHSEINNVGLYSKDISEKAKRHQVVQTVEEYKECGSLDSRMRLSLYASCKNRGLANFARSYMDAEDLEVKDFLVNRSRSYTKRDGLQKPREIKAYDRENILSKMTLSDAGDLVATRTSFKVNPQASNHSQIVFSESGKGTSVQVRVKEGRPVAYNFKDGVGGDIIGFVSHYAGVSYGELCKELGDRLGIEKTSVLKDRPTQVSQHKTSVSREDILRSIREKQTERQADIEKIQWVSSQTVNIEGTPAKSYLAQRGIVKSLSPDITFNDYKKFGYSMMCFGRDSKGTITSYQRTSIDEFTHYKSHQENAKLSKGCVTGSSVPVQNDTKELGVTFLAEGVETALSLREAGVSGEIRATFGKSNLRNVAMSLDPSQKIILVADNDGKPWQEDKTFVKMMEDLKANDYQVAVIFPESLEKGKKVDFNDILQEERGLKRIRDNVREVMPEAVARVNILDDFKQRLELKETLDSLRIKDPLDIRWKELSKFKSNLENELQRMAFDIARDERISAKLDKYGIEDQVIKYAEHHIDHSRQRSRGLEM